MITDAYQYTKGEEEFFDRLRRKGCCCVCFTPDELQGANPDQVEDRLVELGWEVIDCLKEEDDE